MRFCPSPSWPIVPDWPPDAVKLKVHDRGTMAAEAPATSAREEKVNFIMIKKDKYKP
jgi:hypothetical protein